MHTQRTQNHRIGTKALAVFLTALMLFTCIPLAGFEVSALFPKAKATSYNVGDIITFGGYPQTRVTDEETISALDALEKNWISYNYYSGTGEVDDGQMTSGNWMRYADIEYNCAKYRAVTFDSYRPEYTGYQSKESYGSHLATSNNTVQAGMGYHPNNVYYFKYEPLSWTVLDPAERLVLSRNVIDSQAYQNTFYYNSTRGAYYQGINSNTYANDYASSSIRNWLLTDFYNTAFSSDEKLRIASTQLDNSACSTDYSRYNSSSTNDKIFLLSYLDVQNSAYGFNIAYADDDGRCIQPTDYAKCQGCHSNSMDAPGGGNAYWMLRTPGSGSEYSAIVSNEGWVYDRDYVYDTSSGVCPAFRFASAITEDVYPTGHTYELQGWTWTKTENGYDATAHFECTRDSDHKQDVLATVTSETTAPDCENSGQTVYTATVSFEGNPYSNTKTVTLDATGHDFTSTTYRDNGDGTHSVKCKNCDAYGAVIDGVQTENGALNCTYGGWAETKAANCVETGSKERVCSACSHKETATIGINADNHKSARDVEATDSTCIAHGYTAGVYCDACEKWVSGHEEKPFANHTWDSGVIDPAPTCTAAGTKTFTCTVTGCGATYTDPLNATGHDFTSTTYRDNGDGTHSVKCKNCDAYGAVIDGVQTENGALDCTYGSWAETKAANCVETGSKERVCSACSHKETATIGINADNHKSARDVEATDSTCIAHGYTAGVYCDACEKWVSGHEEKPLAAHTWDNGATVTEPTCKTTGLKRYTCTVAGCGATKDETLPVDGAKHNYVAGEPVAPTCTAQGYTVYTCSRCGDTVNKDYVSPKGHTPGTPEKINEIAATCVSEGSYTLVTKCTVCTAEIGRETVTTQMKPHTLEVIPAIPATCTQKGRTAGSRCSVCGVVFSTGEPTDKLPHTDNNGDLFCDNCGYDMHKRCGYCGEIHTGFLGGLIGLIHQFLLFFKNIFHR